MLIWDMSGDAFLKRQEHCKAGVLERYVDHSPCSREAALVRVAAVLCSQVAQERNLRRACLSCVSERHCGPWLVPFPYPPYLPKLSFQAAPFQG